MWTIFVHCSCISPDNKSYSKVLNPLQLATSPTIILISKWFKMKNGVLVSLTQLIETIYNIYYIQGLRFEPKKKKKKWKNGICQK